MNVLLKFRIHVRIPKLLEMSIMSTSSDKVYYAVARGKATGIYGTWKECKEQTDGFCGAKYRKFYTLEEAEEFVHFWKEYSPLRYESIETKNLVSNALYEEWNIINEKRINKRMENLTNIKISFTLINSPKYYKPISVYALGDGLKTEDGKTVCLKSLKLFAVPYISSSFDILRYSFTNLINTKRINKLRDSEEDMKIKKPPKVVNNHSQIFVYSSLIANLKEQNQNFQKDYQQQIKPTLNITLDDFLNWLANCKSLITFFQNISILSGILIRKSSNDNCSVLLNGFVTRIVKKVSLTINGQKKSKENECCKKLQVRDKLDSCLNRLYLAVKLKLITSQNASESEELKKLITNTYVNLQMNPEENADKLCENSKNFHNEQLVVEEEAISSHHQLSPQRSCVQLQTPSPHSTSVEGKVDHKSVDMLALSLRLDSFEKRFDAVLKEVGAIISEVQHLKSDIKELKESLSSESACSPRRGKDGLMQTTLSFNSRLYNDSTLRVSPNKRKATDLKTPEPSNRNLKRRRSRSNSSQSDSDSTDDSLSSIKIEADSFIVDKDDYVAVYTDGCALSNGQGDAKAGIGIWFGDDHPLNLGRAVVGPPTNNTAEIQAARVAMQRAIKAGIKKLKIHTDSEFLINCATKWIYRWKKNGWLAQTGKPVKNRKELEKLDKVASKIKIRWEKVLAHSNIKGNEAADRLANLGAPNYKRHQPRSHQS